MSETRVCNACQTTLMGDFCHSCGVKAHIERIDNHYLLHELIHLFHWEKGFFKTFRLVQVNPGASIRFFIFSNRSYLMKPIFFIVITSLIYSLLGGLFSFNQQVAIIAPKANMKATNWLSAWIPSHWSYVNMAMCFFVAMFMKWFFRRAGYNVYEYFIARLYLIGVGMLHYGFFAVAKHLTGWQVFDLLPVLTSAYIVWGMVDFIESHKFISYVKAAAAYILGGIVCTGLAFSICILVDVIRLGFLPKFW
jgi:hypothetical protein